MTELQELALRRLERARESITTAENVLQLLDEPKTAANRTYYGVFHGMRSMLALLGLDSKNIPASLHSSRTNICAPPNSILPIPN